MRIAIPTIGKRKLTNRVSDTFSRAPSFTILNLDGEKITETYVIKNPAAGLEKGAGPIAARTIKDQGTNLLITSEMGPGARNILEAFDIRIHVVPEGKKVKEAVEDWLSLGLDLSQ